MADQLHQIGIEATVKQMDSAAWFPALARRYYQIGGNLTAGGFDDPDAYFFENYKCGSSRNYSDYCNEEVDRLIDEASAALSEDERKAKYGRAQQLIAEDAPYIPIWNRVNAIVAQPGLTGLHLGLTGDFQSLRDVRWSGAGRPSDAPTTPN